MGLVTRLADIRNNPEDFVVAGELFRCVNIRLYFQFRDERAGKRTLRKVAGGVVTFGNAQPPITIYEGPTARGKLRKLMALEATNPGGAMSPLPESEVSDSEGKSLGNVDRGDRIRTCDLLTPRMHLTPAKIPRIARIFQHFTMSYDHCKTFSKRAEIFRAIRYGYFAQNGNYRFHKSTRCANLRPFPPSAVGLPWNMAVLRRSLQDFPRSETKLVRNVSQARDAAGFEWRVIAT